MEFEFGIFWVFWVLNELFGEGLKILVLKIVEIWEMDGVREKLYLHRNLAKCRERNGEKDKIGVLNT